MIATQDITYNENLANSHSSIVGLAYTILPSTHDEDGKIEDSAETETLNYKVRKEADLFRMNIDEHIETVTVASADSEWENISLKDNFEKTINEEEALVLIRRLKRLKALANLSGKIRLKPGVTIQDVINFFYILSKFTFKSSSISFCNCTSPKKIF